MEIVPASIRDLAALHRLEHACFDRDGWPLIDLIAVLTFPDVVRLKAVENGTMIGFVAGDPRKSEGFSWIATLGVLPESRRQGVGRKLLRACEELLRTPQVRLSVRASNLNAIRLYEQEGYATLDVWRKYYADGEDAIVMEKARRANVI